MFKKLILLMIPKLSESYHALSPDETPASIKSWAKDSMRLENTPIYLLDKLDMHVPEKNWRWVQLSDLRTAEKPVKVAKSITTFGDSSSSRLSCTSPGFFTLREASASTSARSIRLSQTMLWWAIVSIVRLTLQRPSARSRCSLRWLSTPLRQDGTRFCPHCSPPAPASTPPETLRPQIIP